VWLRIRGIVSKYGKLKEQKDDSILPHDSISPKLNINLLKHNPFIRKIYPG
jgi:hypothetical protein